MTVLDDSAADKRYTDWIGRKKATLRRPTLDCGCANKGDVAFHLWCDRLACEKHAEDPHDCSEFKGNSSIEKEAATVEAATVLPVRPALPLHDDLVSFDAGIGTEAPVRRSDRQPTRGPINPEVHEALRREVRRQGLTTYEIDGVTYHVDQPDTVAEAWSSNPSSNPIADITAAYRRILDHPTFEQDAHAFRVNLATFGPVDAALEPDPTPYRTCLERLGAEREARGPGINEPPFSMSFNDPWPTTTTDDQPPVPWWRRKPWRG